MNQAVKLEWEQKFANLQDAEIMNISPQSSTQNSESESDRNQKLMPYVVTGDINPDNIETGTVTRNKISTTDGKTKEDTTTTTMKMATKNQSSKI